MDRLPDDDVIAFLSEGTRTPDRYLSADRAVAFGGRNGVPGELVVRAKLTKVRNAFGLTNRR